MEQYSFFDNELQPSLLHITKKNRAFPRGIVNVASVPQRSPFRYPGGKTWLIPQIRDWLNSLKIRPTHFIEPFVGGGIVSLTVAFENLAEHITMIELDSQVAAVWQTILKGDAKALAGKIANFNLTPETLEVELNSPVNNLETLAFQTILKNRTNRGGILAPGAGKVKYGENGKGLLSRWYPSTISRRILEIAQIRDRINFFQSDGLEIILKYIDSPNTAFFIDPPYTASTKKAGSRLYLHSTIDHEKLFYLVSNLSGDFLMTYDNAPEIHKLAKNYKFDTELIAMKNTHNIEMAELLISRNLKWARL